MDDKHTLTRRNLTLNIGVTFTIWVAAASFLPSLRFLPQSITFGFLSCIVVLFYLLLTTSKPFGSNERALSDRGHDHKTLFSARAEVWLRETNRLQRSESYNRPQLRSFDPRNAILVSSILENIEKDFVKSWYSKIASSGIFLNEVDRALRTTVENVASAAQAIDVAELLVARLLPIIKNHVRDYHDAEIAVRGKDFSKSMTDTDELSIAIAARYRHGKTHPAATLAASRSTAPQQKHLRKLTSLILPNVLPHSILASAIVETLVKELVACAVLLPLASMIADPDFLCQQVESFGHSILQERKSVKKLRAALDQQTLTNGKATRSIRVPQLTSNDSERNFERFIRSIRQISSLSEARKYRGEVSRQHAKESERHSSESTYLKRLEIGKKLLDQRVIQLSGQPSGRQSQSRSDGQTFNKAEASLREILYDASGLSYFMEFMDRLQLVSFVQFWIVVDGLKNPLDSDAETWTESERQDLISLSSGYLGRSELHVPLESQELVKAFVRAGEKATAEHYRAARDVVDEIQKQIFQEMNEKCLPSFKRSDLFYKWAALDSVHGKPESVSSGRPSMEVEFVDPLKRSSSPQPNNKSEHHALRASDLRRGLSSSSSITADLRRPALPPDLRKSTDDGSRRALFTNDEDGNDTDPLVDSVTSLNSDFDMREQNRVEAAVQDALDDIVEQSDVKQALFDDDPFMQDVKSHSRAQSAKQTKLHAPLPILGGDKPSLASLGLLGTPHKRTVFSEGDLFGESEKLWEDDDKDQTNSNDQSGPEEEPDEIVEAAPGDLGLTEIIQALSMDIDKLETQQKIVDSLTGKAELTNNAAELKILRKSRMSLDREIQRKQLQKQQYIVQESENTLYGRATIAIKSVMVGNEPDGHEYAIYVIEILRPATDKSGPTSWAVGRRYSEFHQLHKALGRRFRYVREIDFPRRQTLMTLQKDFLKKRRSALERFLQELLKDPAVCRSLEFRAFLSQQAIRPLSDSNPQLDRQDLITRIYNSVTDGMDEFLGNMPVLDQISAAGQNIISAAAAAATFSASNPTTPSTEQSLTTALGSNANAFSVGATSDDPATNAEVQKELRALEEAGSAANKEATTFVTPIVDAFVEIFQLQTATGNAWLRGRTIVIILQQILGGTVERRVREMARSFTASEAIGRYLKLVQDGLWPPAAGGKFKEAGPARTPREKERCKREASAVLSTLFEEMAGGVVGRGAASEAGKRIARCFMNERLNSSLVFELLDEIADVVF